MEELYREESGTSTQRKIFAVIALLMIASLYWHEWTWLQEHRRFDMLGWGMDTVLLALWIWRVAFGYTLILYKDMKLEVISHGLCFIKRSYVVDLTRTESFTDKYVKSFFRKTAIKHYIIAIIHLMKIRSACWYLPKARKIRWRVCCLNPVMSLSVYCVRKYRINSFSFN